MYQYFCLIINKVKKALKTWSVDKDRCSFHGVGSGSDFKDDSKRSCSLIQQNSGLTGRK